MKTESNLATFLKQKREQAGLSQKQVSEKLGYSTPQFVSNWERGLSAPPIKIVKKLAEMYRISGEELFNHLLEETLQQVRRDFMKLKKKVL
ncbi:MAG TPA: helix-turn-helix transcriptional regulator [Bdellovibrio sp.]|nr:helix-turn-helix transcriptional regulator [Bdellovibrio sp.]